MDNPFRRWKSTQDLYEVRVTPPVSDDAVEAAMADARQWRSELYGGEVDHHDIEVRFEEGEIVVGFNGGHSAHAADAGPPNPPIRERHWAWGTPKVGVEGVAICGQVMVHRGDDTSIPICERCAQSKKAYDKHQRDQFAHFFRKLS